MNAAFPLQTMVIQEGQYDDLGESSEEEDESVDVFPPAADLPNSYAVEGLMRGDDADGGLPVSSSTAQEYESRIRTLEQLNSTLKENIAALYAESASNSLQNSRETCEHSKPSRARMELSQDEGYYTTCTAIIPYNDSNSDLRLTDEHILKIRKLEKSINKLQNKVEKQKRVISQLSYDLKTASNKIEDLMASGCDGSQTKLLALTAADSEVHQYPSRVVQDKLQSILYLMEQNSANRARSTERLLNEFQQMDTVHKNGEATETFAGRLERVIRELRGERDSVADQSVLQSDDNDGAGERDSTFNPVMPEEAPKQSVRHPTQSQCTSETELINNKKSTIRKCPSDLMTSVCSTTDLSMSQQGVASNEKSAGTSDQNESLVLGYDETFSDGAVLIHHQQPGDMIQSNNGGLEKNVDNDNANGQPHKSFGTEVYGNDDESHEEESIVEPDDLGHGIMQSDSSSNEVCDDSDSCNYGADKELVSSIQSHLCEDSLYGRDRNTLGGIGYEANDDQYDRSIRSTSEIDADNSDSAKCTGNGDNDSGHGRTGSPTQTPASIFDYSLSCLVPSKSYSREDPNTPFHAVGDDNGMNPTNRTESEVTCHKGSSRSDLNCLSMDSLKTWDDYAMRRRKSNSRGARNVETSQHASQSDADKDPLSARLSRRQLFEYIRTTAHLDTPEKSTDSKQSCDVLVRSVNGIDFTPPLAYPALPPLDNRTAPKFRKGLEDGYYIYKSSSGNEYLGDWKDGKRHGHGVAKYRDGEIYCGGWVKGQRHGLGTLYLANSEEVFDGSWNANKKHGLGTYFWSDGEVDVSWYFHDVRKESLRWSKDRKSAFRLDLKTSKKTNIDLYQATQIVRDWENRKAIIDSD